MFFVSEIEIEGLAGRKESFKKKLNAGLNVLFGANGSGKTSILKIIHSALVNEPKLLTGVPFQKAKLKMETDFGFKLNREVFRESTKVIEASKTLALAPSPIEIKVPDMEHGDIIWKCTAENISSGKTYVDADFEIGHGYLPTTRLSLGIETGYGLGRSLISEEELDKHFGRLIKDLWASYTHNISLDVNRIQDEALTQILMDVLAARDQERAIENIDLEEGFDKVKNFLKRRDLKNPIDNINAFTNQYNSDKNFKNVISVILDVENKIADARKTKLKFQQLIEKMFSGDKKLSFSDREISLKSGDDQKINLGCLSSGEKHLLYILIETMSAKESTIIIDEPEISMHVDWQEVLIESMMELNPKAQIIMATHSPEITSKVNDEALIRI